MNMLMLLNEGKGMIRMKASALACAEVEEVVMVAEGMSRERT